MRFDDLPYTRWQKVGAWLATFVITLSVFWLITGCSSLRTYATGAQAADLATTAVALSNGASEANALLAGASPVGWAAAAVGKLAGPALARSLPPSVCKPAQTVLFGVGAGAAANNLLVLAGASGGFPLAIPLSAAAMVAYRSWGGAEHDCRRDPWQDLYEHYRRYGFSRPWRS